MNRIASSNADPNATRSGAINGRREPSAVRMCSLNQPFRLQSAVDVTSDLEMPTRFGSIAFEIVVI